MQRLVLVSLFLAISQISLGNCQNWWDLFSDPTTVPPTTTINPSDPLLDYYDINDEGICCECVPFYLCNEQGSIIDNGAVLDPRFGAEPERNVDVCTDVTKLCCRVPSAPENCLTANKTTSPPVITNQQCECIHWELCLEEYRVSDGSTPTTFVLGNPLPRHAKCNHDLHVCCAFDEDPTGTDPSTGFGDNGAGGVLPPTGSGPQNDCVCVNPWLCDQNNRVITDGDGILDLKSGFGSPNAEGECLAPSICCGYPDRDRTLTPTPPPLPPPVVIEDQRCHGVRNSEGISVRIAGFKDGEAQFGEYPWVGMVLNTYFVAGQPMNSFIGGAILIHPRVMLTAAHKVVNESVNTLNVRVGEWDIQTDYEPGEHQIRNIAQIVIHPSFNGKTLYHDVALLVLEEPVIFQQHIRSICMASSLEEVDTSRCVINGWGEDNFGSDNYQTVMKSVELPLVPHKRCQAMLRRTRLGRWFRLHNSFMCAGGTAGKDACRSDGGGPLACPRVDDPTEYLLVGITAWGVGCGEDQVPGVYASVLEDKNWINEEVFKLAPGNHNLLKRDVTTASSSDYRDLIGDTTKQQLPTTTTSTLKPRSRKLSQAEKRRRRIERERRRRLNRRRFGKTTFASW